MVGKYTGLSDSYLSVLKVTLLFISSAQIQFRTKCVGPYLFSPFCQALLHASVALGRKLVVDWVPSCDLEDSTAEEVSFALSILLFYVRE